jgi:dipeptidyl aminopeptidase/acylaminoacyl peptidase
MFIKLICFVVACLLFFIFFVKDKLIYFPDKMIYQLNHSHDLQEFDVTTPDNTIINGYYVKNPKKKYTILYCHGNAGNIYSRIPSLDSLLQTGSVIMFDYRGYGKSEGQPSEKGLYQDAFAVWEYATKTLQIPSEELIFYGESLGGGVASWLAFHTNTPSKKLILRSAFSSIHDMTPYFLKFMTYIIPNELPTINHLEKLDDKTSVLFIHSKDDEVVPFDHCVENMKKTKNAKLYLYNGYHNKELNDGNFKDFMCEWMPKDASL